MAIVSVRVRVLIAVLMEIQFSGILGLARFRKISLNYLILNVNTLYTSKRRQLFADLLNIPEDSGHLAVWVPAVFAYRHFPA
jgi:hypothetical protein